MKKTRQAKAPYVADAVAGWKTSPKPLQAVFSQVQVPFEHEDWSLLCAEEQQSRTKDYMLKDRKRGFAISSDGQGMCECRL